MLNENINLVTEDKKLLKQWLENPNLKLVSRENKCSTVPTLVSWIFIDVILSQMRLILYPLCPFANVTDIRIYINIELGKSKL